MRMFIGGDICPTNITAPYYASGNFEALFGEIPQLVKGSDAFLANVECAITDYDKPITKMGPNLKAPVETAETLRAFGITAVSLSNNHTFDFGTSGFLDTMRYLEKAGIAYTGVGENEQAARKPMYLTLDGMRVAVVCVCEHEYSYALHNKLGTWAFDPLETLEEISKAKAASDYTIFMYHGGKERCEYPSPRLRKACQAMVRAGADLVLCQHSHCIGTMETYREKHIVYGQGNFNFVSHSDNPQWTCGLLLELLVNAGKAELIWHPVVTTDTGIRLADQCEKKEILDGFFSRSETLNDGRWLEGWHKFCEENCDYYRAGITGDLADTFPDMPEEQLRQFFPHFLDCEAHTDVWRELFPTWHGANNDERE